VLSTRYWFLKNQHKQWLSLGHSFVNFIGDVKRVWPGPGRQGLVLLQVGISVPPDTVTEPFIPAAAAK